MKIRNFFCLTTLLYIVHSSIAVPYSKSVQELQNEVENKDLSSDRATKKYVMKNVPVSGNSQLSTRDASELDQSNNMPDPDQSNNDLKNLKNNRQKANEKLSVTHKIDQLSSISTVHPMAYVQLTQKFDKDHS